MPRSQAEIIDAALAGEQGVLEFEFRSDDLGARRDQINEAIRTVPAGLAVKLLVNPKDGERQPVPIDPAVDRFRSWGPDPAVPVGKFHLAISSAR